MAVGDGPSDEAARVAVETLPEGGVRIDDRIQRRTYTIRTGGSVSPVQVDGDRFRYPTDIAIALSTDHLEFAPTGASFVHEAESTTEVELFDHEEFPAGRYIVELSGPLKAYAEVTGPLEVENRVRDVRIDLAEAETVVVGARSSHQRPAATVTTTDAPRDVMQAVSTFGSELKTRGSKRSYPTLRGHPPAIEVGEELSVPSGIEPASGNVHVEVPAELECVLPATPLAYYLGAAVRPSDTPALVVDGTRHRLDASDGFERAVERTLKRSFFLDSLVRTESQRDVMLFEREVLDGTLGVDLEALHGRSAAERLEAYLDVPYGAIEEHLPEWELTAHVQPGPQGIEALPFLVNDLAVVRVHDGPTAGGDPTGGESERVAGRERVVNPPSTASLTQTWVGPGVPIGASKTTPQAYRNWMARGPTDDEEVRVAVVCNDEEMLEEGDSAREAYGSDLNLPYDVTFHDDLDTEGLRLVFESDLDYVHYVGHVGEDGFECSDGALDIEPLDEVGVDIAFLNACDSYEQGAELIARGAVASVVTFDEVLDEGALRIGKTMARLLNRGFTLDSALAIARRRSIVGSQYLVVGNGNAEVAQPRGLVPWVAEVESAGGEEYRVRVTPHLPGSGGMGYQFRPGVGEDPPVFLVPKELPEVTTTTDGLREYFESGSFPVFFDGEFTWSSEAIDAL